MRKGFSPQTTRTFQNHSCPSPLTLPQKVSPPSDRLRLQLPTRHAMGQLPQGPCVSMLSLCSLCTHGVNPHPLQPPRGHPETTHMHTAAEQRDLFTFHPELQLDLQQKQKYCCVCFFPEMIIIVL